MAAGLLLAPLTSEPWHLYLTIGLLVGAGSVCLGYSGQSLFLPNWFVRKRGLAVGIAFAGVGIGSITLLPWMQVLIEQAGWRTACWTLGLLILGLLVPINLLLRKRPQDLGLQPDGDAAPVANAGPRIECRRSRLGVHRLDAVTCDPDAAVLVAGAGLLLRLVWLVRGAGSPDKISHRDRLLRQHRRLGARLRQPGRHSRADLARPPLGPHRPRVDLDHRLPRLCDMFSCADGAAVHTVNSVALCDGAVARLPRLRRDVDLRRRRPRDLRGQAFRQHLRHAHAGRAGGRRRRSVDHRRHRRSDGQLRGRVLDRPDRLRGVDPLDLDGRSAQDPRRRRSDTPVAARGAEPLTSAAESPAAAEPPSGSGR